MTVVLDASALIELLLATPAGGRIREYIAGSEQAVHVPFLADIELAQTLRRMLRAREVSLQEAGHALAAYRSLPLTRHPHEPLLDRIWQLRVNLTAYDATYVALAEVLGAALVTCDRGIARAPGHAAAVVCVEVRPLLN